jgi:hypothetical protein
MVCTPKVPCGKVGQLTIFLYVAVFFCLPAKVYSQAWSGILNSSRAIDWSTAGIPGGIPTRNTNCTTLNAATYGNGSSDATSAINSALSSCASGQVVSLGAGTFLINGNIQVPSNVTLRGAGANQTILQAHNTSGPVISLGNGGVAYAMSNAVSITGGSAAGSTSITVSSTSGVTVGGYLVIDQLNDGVTVTSAGSEGSCTWCDNGQGGTRTQGQIVEVTSVSGNTVGINPGLFVSYILTPHATPFTATKYAGVEALQVSANQTGAFTNFAINTCAYCWLNGVEGNYADGDHVEVDFSYHGIIMNSYFSNAYTHAPGTYDSDLTLRNKSTGMLVQNNIFERLHVSMMLEWGAAGNVFAYNYSLGNFDSGSPNAAMNDVDMHGAHPQFNLFEGNDVMSYGQDNIWGSSANNTFFRNWARGTTKACNPTSGRGTVSCAPLGTQGLSSVNGWWEFQGVRAVNATYEVSNMNDVGNVIGSSDMASLHAYGNSSVMPEVPMAWAICGSSPCGAGSRSYDQSVYGYAFGYAESGSDGSGTGCAGGTGICYSLTPWTTFFLHGDYSNITSNVTWNPGTTQTLPTSLYLTAKPSWWGNVPFPAIGPDVSSGWTVSGHVNKIPARVCYESVMGGSDGTNSPMTFNAATCYGGLPFTIAPPTGLNATVQ